MTQTKAVTVDDLVRGLLAGEKDFKATLPEGADLAGHKSYNALNDYLRKADLRAEPVLAKGSDWRGIKAAGFFCQGIKLAGGDLRETNLAGADLRRADLTNANLSGANVEGAFLTNSRMPGSTLRAPPWPSSISTKPTSVGRTCGTQTCLGGCSSGCP